MPLRAILFDLGDTVVRLEPFPDDMAARLAVHLVDAGIPGTVAQQAARQIAAAVRRDVTDASSNGRREEVDIARLAAGELAAAGMESHLALGARIADAYGEADISRIADVAGRVELLGGFRQRGLRLGIVSNTTTRPELLNAMLDRFGLAGVFDVLTYSSEQGVRKPYPEIYRRTLSSLGVDAADALFVGDRLREDVIGPTRAGMRAVLTQEFHQDAHDGEPFAVIRRLEDLRQIVPRL